jgi:excisionase family DNA binding protein
MSQEWVTTTQAAELLGVHAETARRYVRFGQLPARRLPSGHIRIRRSEVQRLLRDGPTPPGDSPPTVATALLIHDDRVLMTRQRVLTG